MLDIFWKKKDTTENRKQELEKLGSFFMAARRFNSFCWVLDKLGREPAANEVLAFIGDPPYKLDIWDIQHLLEHLSTVPIDVLDKIVDYYLGLGRYNIHAICNITAMGASKPIIQRLLDQLIESVYNPTENVLRLTLLLNLEEKEKQGVVAKCVLKGNLNLAQEAKKGLLGEDLTENELQSLLKQALASADSTSVQNIFTILNRKATETEVDLIVMAMLEKSSNIRVTDPTNTYWLLHAWKTATGEFETKASATALKQLAKSTITILLELCKKSKFNTALEDILSKTDVLQNFPNSSQSSVVEIKGFLFAEAIRLLTTTKYDLDIKKALSLLEVIGIKKLPADLIEKAIEHVMKISPSFLKNYVKKIAGFGATQSTVDKLLLNETLYYDDAVELGASKKALEELLKQYVSRGLICPLMDNILKDLGRKLSADELATIRKALSKK